MNELSTFALEKVITSEICIKDHEAICLLCSLEAKDGCVAYQVDFLIL